MSNTYSILASISRISAQANFCLVQISSHIKPVDCDDTTYPMHWCLPIRKGWKTERLFSGFSLPKNRSGRNSSGLLKFVLDRKAGY